MSKVFNFFMIIALSLCYCIYGTSFKINYYFAIVVLTVFSLMFLIKIKQKNKISQDEIKIYKILFYPEIFIIIFGFIALVISGNINSLMIKKFLAKIVFIFVTTTSACSFYNIEKEKGINMLFCAAIINYLFFVVLEIKEHGIMGIFNYIIKNINGDFSTYNILEQHEITFCFSLFVIFFAFIKQPKCKWKFILCLLFFILGFKRIAILALVCTFLISKILNSNFFKKNNFVNILVGILFFSIILIWMYFIKNDVFSIISYKYNINFMGRIKLYSLVKNEFEISPLFLGNGLGYIAYWGEINGNLTGHHALHSTFIEMYINIGFIGCFIYLILKSTISSIKIKKQFGYDKSKYYIIFLIYNMIISSTDNIGNYLNYNFLFNVLLISTILNHSNSNNKFQKRREVV